MKNIIIIAGPTAVGKTDLAMATAKHYNGEIVSADSMQIYKYMDIGSAKPTEEEQREVKHYLVDEIDPRDEFSAAEYCKKAKSYINTIIKNGKQPIVSGGTGLYINTLIYDMDFSGVPDDKNLRTELEKLAELKGNQYIYEELKKIDPRAAETVHANNLKRVIRALEINRLTGKNMASFRSDPVKTKDYKVKFICLNRDRQELYDRIDTRVDIMLNKGLIEEVEKLKQMGLNRNHISMQGIGYKEVIDFLDGIYSEEKMIEIIKRNSRHYAKRQLTWFKRYKDVSWLDLSKYGTDKGSALEALLELTEI